MKKHLLIIILIFATFGIFFASVYVLKQKPDPIVESKVYLYKVSGAALHTNQVKSTKKLSYKELFFLVQIFPYADISNFPLNNYAPENNEIFIPYKKNKIHISKLKTIKQLTNLNIDKNIAQKIIQLIKSKKHNITWKNILSIPNMDDITYQKLSNILIID
ncbi:hypothetical protein GE118_04275 [Mycoplasma sp. NEAQ87857]|uniref:MAG0490 family ComEA-like DNA-binding protein n=1 Tax=Mycoplasma sp. NEAQ87857 TaxID=2683967 RepID=UPI001315C670|nr:hypothetical protein [Mycoplasma sp. NEAQ87857]QGZ97992.1 hypothetical protein GE118_04275 [Mycoplasma sp. NEAQ87857]